jgi:hypothetical protein
MLRHGTGRNGCGWFRLLVGLGLAVMLAAPAWGEGRKSKNAPVVEFTGTTFVGKARLRTWATSSSPTADLLTSPYDPDRARTAAALIAQGYKNFGFLDVRVAYRLTVGVKANKDRLVFEIKEGPRYKVAEVRIVGVGVDEQQKLLKDLQLHRGDDCSLEIIRQDREHLQRVLAAEEQQFTIRERTSAAAGKVVVVYEVTRGGVLVIGVGAAPDTAEATSGVHIRQWLSHHQAGEDVVRKASNQVRQEAEQVGWPSDQPCELDAWGGRVRQNMPKLEGLIREVLDTLLEGAIQETLQDQVGRGPDTWDLFAALGPSVYSLIPHLVAAQTDVVPLLGAGGEYGPWWFIPCHWTYLFGGCGAPF